MLNWVKQFNIFCYLDNQQYENNTGYECLLAVDVLQYIDDQSSFQQIDTFLQKGSWYFGHLAYDLKNRLFSSQSKKEDSIGFPLYYFFQPRILIVLQAATLSIEANEPEIIYQQILQTNISAEEIITCDLKGRLDKEDYLHIIRSLQQHILRGDCYEINFCQQFYSEDASISPLDVYLQLNKISPTPFSAFYRLQHRYLVCASPERFISRKGEKIIAQPMKGTSRRDLNNKQSDETLKLALATDAKEKAENVMVVDLVRNDLSKICTEASVRVEELFGVYSFPQVHQMISTISGRLKKDISFSEIIAATFPMGSMTGAPKHRVMELIEEYEPVARGLFSGSIGYIQPNGDFDFNVVIRSIFYNEMTRYLTYSVGSGITFYSNAEKEWEECLLKAEAIKKVLTH